MAGTTVQKQLVLSIGTGLFRHDPAIDYGDRLAERLLFKADMDFILPSHPHLPIDPNCTLLPVSLIREMFETILQPMRSALSLIAADHPRRLWVLCAPPPPRDNAIIYALLTSRAGDTESPSQTLAIPPSMVMLKTWLLLRQCMTAICRDTGCHFIDCASVACDETGFLKPELVHDGIHGNARYYELMTKHVAMAVVASSMAGC